MENLGVLLGEALSRPLGWLAVVLIVGGLIGYLARRDAESSTRLVMLLGILAGFVLLGLSVHQAKSDLDATLPQRSDLHAPRSAVASLTPDLAVQSHLAGAGETAHAGETDKA